MNFNALYSDTGSVIAEAAGTVVTDDSVLGRFSRKQNVYIYIVYRHNENKRNIEILVENVAYGDWRGLYLI